MDNSNGMNDFLRIHTHSNSRNMHLFKWSVILHTQWQLRAVIARAIHLLQLCERLSPYIMLVFSRTIIAVVWVLVVQHSHNYLLSSACVYLASSSLCCASRLRLLLRRRECLSKSSSSSVSWRCCNAVSRSWSRLRVSALAADSSRSRAQTCDSASSAAHRASLSLWRASTAACWEFTVACSTCLCEYAGDEVVIKSEALVYIYQNRFTVISRSNGVHPPRLRCFKDFLVCSLMQWIVFCILIG